jgi:transcriptional regulator with XRE-family HTH domain
MNTPTSEQLDQFARVLGDLLRTARKERGWTRKQMRAEMGADEEDEVSLQTLATYELGTRRLSVERLVELCAVLEQRPDELLLRATTLAFGDHDGRLKVDLSALAHTTDPRLRPLQRWAGVRARQCPEGRAPVEELDAHALTALAGIAGAPMYDLVQALRELRGA